MKSGIFPIIPYFIYTLFGGGGCDQEPSGEKNITQNFDQQAAVDLADGTAVDVNVSVGDCRVTYGNTSTASISADYLIRSTDQKYIDEIMSRAEIKAENVNGVLSISVADKTNGGDIWDWVENTYNNNAELVVDFDIVVPESIHNFNVTSDVGDISFEGLEGKINANGDVGDITVADCYIWNGSVIAAEVGDVELDLSDVNGAFTAKTSTGNVQVRLNSISSGNTSGKLNTSTGNIKVITNGNGYSVVSQKNKGASASKEIIVADKCDLNMKTNCGSISVR